jgi:hypothetical protein
VSRSVKHRDKFAITVMHLRNEFGGGGRNEPHTRGEVVCKSRSLVQKVKTVSVQGTCSHSWLTCNKYERRINHKENGNNRE